MDRKERHRNEDDAEPQHITVRAYRRGRGVLTAHVYVDDQYSFQGYTIFGTGKRIRAETCIVYWYVPF